MFKTGILILFLFLIMVYYYKNSINNFVLTKSETDGEVYKTHRDFSGKESAEIMGSLNKLAIELLIWLKKNRPLDGEFMTLIKRYNYQQMVENSPHNWPKTSSYMHGKGRIFAICLRKPSGQFYPFDLLFFVFLHELAHLMINEYEHPKEYWIAFKKLLIAAAQSGLYYPINYKQNPTSYGGKSLAHNPYFDNNIALID